MRRMSFLLAILLSISLSGCTERAVFCTQERVCKEGSIPDSYELLFYGRDTGFVIPGLKQNFVPQGLAVWQEANTLLLSGYFMPLSGSVSSVLLALDGTNGKLVGEYTLIDSVGRNIGGHFSGVAVTERDLIVTGDHCLYRIPLACLGKGRTTLKVEQIIPLEISSDSCGFGRGELWVCEYYQQNRFPLQEEHVVFCGDGTEHHAWMVCYAFEDGLEAKCVFSIPDKIQGVAVLKDGALLLSQSYGRKNASSLLVYDDPRSQPPDSYVMLADRMLPMWNLDKEHLRQNISAPPMTEGCCGSKDGVYLIFESAAYYYRSFNADNRSIHPTDTIWLIRPEPKTEH